ncbi:SDR family oxidoreductase [Candidatus Woesearchaeota archaeon]|nr:SDR family oxidoreductase [Candidatus Woesearchaeota archaeon]
MSVRRLFLQLATQEPDLGEAHIQLPDLREKVLLVVGASYASGFGYNLGKVARTEANAHVIMTASEEAKRSRLEARINKSGFEADTAVLDVTKDRDIAAMRELLQERYGKLDYLVITSANIALQYLKQGITWDDVPETEREKCRAVTVYPIQRLTTEFRELMRGGSSYAISFCGHDMPGYSIGGAKKELEELVTGKGFIDSLDELGIRANIISLGSFDSISSSAVPGVQVLRKYIDELGARKLTLGEMVRESIATFVLQDKGRIYNIDGGLRQALADPINSRIVQRLYEEAR